MTDILYNTRYLEPQKKNILYRLGMFAPDSWDRTQEGDQRLLTTRRSTTLLLVARLASSSLRALTSVQNHTHRKLFLN